MWITLWRKQKLSSLLQIIVLCVLVGLSAFLSMKTAQLLFSSF